jgi:hypothetical protein
MSTTSLPIIVIMKSTTKPHERKTPHSVQNQLAARNAAPKKGALVSHFVPITGDDLKETIKEVSAKLKPAKSAPAKANKADKAVTKAKRVFKKAGCPDPTDAEVKTYLAKLAKSGQKSSRTVAKEIREGVAEGTERNSKHADRRSTPKPTQARFDPSPTT